MKRLIMAAAASLLAANLALAQAPAAPAVEKKAPSEKQIRQQDRMKACNAQAGDRKGDARKAFMSECLKDKQGAQQERMKACNKEAGDKKLKGDARKAFMSECLKADKPAEAKPAEAVPAEPKPAAAPAKK
ncbi:MAG: phosphate starvation-inducible protein PsiF [Zoogloeaceae bacterium]|nr:phosphate starvation-inducible protein PsiF [Zoogloeaceae bacterium]